MCIGEVIPVTLRFGPNAGLKQISDTRQVHYSYVPPGLTGGLSLAVEGVLGALVGKGSGRGSGRNGNGSLYPLQRCELPFGRQHIDHLGRVAILCLLMFTLKESTGGFSFLDSNNLKKIWCELVL